jgi:RimJ/RimL family protein N-acetyltransferase
VEHVGLGRQRDVGAVVHREQGAVPYTRLGEDLKRGELRFGLDPLVAQLDDVDATSERGVDELGEIAAIVTRVGAEVEAGVGEALADFGCIESGHVRHPMGVIKTDRLILRPWRPEDRAPFAAMNADPAVMEFFVSTMTREESDSLADKIEAGFAERGFGLWAVEELETGEFLGFAGLIYQSFEAHFTPAFEIGYRLARPAWGKGYATEASRAAVAYGFTEAGLSDIVSMTCVPNVRSQNVMRKLGMTHDPADDFDHPRVPDGHPFKRHVLYRLTAEQWRELNPA